MARRALAALLVVLCFLLARSEAALTAPFGGCEVGTSGYAIHSPGENDKGAQYLMDNGIAFAILPATVTNGVVTWENGEVAAWMPPDFQAPSDAHYCLILRKNGAWSVVSMPFTWNHLCIDGREDGETTTMTTQMPNTTTTSTTTTTPAPTANPHLSSSSFQSEGSASSSFASPITTTTLAPSPTTSTTAAPPPSVPTVSSVMQTVRSVVFAAVPTVNVMDFTSNVVYLPATATLVESMQALQAASIVIAVRFGATGPVSALLTDATAASVSFHVPHELYNVSVVTSHALSLVTLNTADVLVVGSQLRITPVLIALQQMSMGVVLSDESILEGTDILATVRFAGAGTALLYTTDVSKVITSTLSFSMVNNGAVGSRCKPSTSSIPYFITRYDVRFLVPGNYTARVHAGRKSVCATYNGKSVVVAPLAIQGIAATTTAASFPAATAIPIRLQGGTTTGIARGAYAAFASASSDCTSEGAKISLLPVNSFNSSSDSSAVPGALLVASSEVPTGSYVCMRRTSTNTKFAVRYHGKPVTVGAASMPPAAAATAPVLTIFNGSCGSLNLLEFVRPPASEDDIAAYLSAASNVSEAYRVFRFVAVKAGATAADKADACRRFKQEATRDAANGAMQFSFPFYLQQTNGVLCADEEYVRIDYTVIQPTNWLMSMAGVSDFASRMLVLSSGPEYDAVPLSVRSSRLASVGSGTAVRISQDGSCAFGYTARIQSYNTQQYIAVPTASVGVYTLCAGLYNETGTSMFVSTGSQVDLASYVRGRRKWMHEAGIERTEWTPCGSASTCGLHTQQAYIEVCNGAVRRNVWPQRLDGAFVGSDSAMVLMAGNLYKTQAIVLMNDVYVPVAAAFAHCQQFSLLQLSTDDGATYGPAAVVLGNHPQIALSPVTDVSGVIVGFVPWNAMCRGVHTGADVMVARTAAGISVIDISGLLFTKSEGYYAVCVRNGVAWARVTDTYIKVVIGGVTVYQAEAINTGDALANQKSIHLYQTQTATWGVAGTFSPSVSLLLKLVWMDSTCTMDAAYTAALRYISPSSAHATVEASLIAAAPAGVASPTLYPCYTANTFGNTAAPMPFEEHRGRSITVTQLTLSSLFYLPYLELSVSAPVDTRILLTEPQDPPITRVSLRVTSSQSDVPQCGAAATYATVLTIETDDLGRRWMTVPAWVPQTLGGSGATNVYLKMCATASSSANPEFVAVEAYLVLSANATNLAGNPMSLRLTFLPLNSSTDLLDYKAAQYALVKYAATELKVPETVVLVASLGNNAFELFIDDALQTGAAPQSTLTPTQQLYQTLAKGTNLPLFLNGRDNATAWFALAKAEAVHLVDQTSVDDYPALALPVSGSAGKSFNYTGLSIALFCVVVAPTTIGFVAFSVQQTIPTLSHSRFGKKTAVCVETGDSPPPRNPCSPMDLEADGGAKKDEARDVPLVVPRAEDTTQCPLYDSDDEGATHEMKDMGTSPPLRNDTFAMAHRKGVSSRSSVEDEERS
ncbi:conserved hypothetical protein [Leishmania infantum JPCM5]|uniref:Uncharacterized protein n=2 Tax=Leishmania infantum TaxID=5671 RepID=E9AGR9_LEIIN|nr:conserved hypothetical protein [Leishmania infantum JPCM5]CAC9482308.1 hypothetical_protein_-_conserved [Leishmania infantum]CBZ08581.1 conserved hypothetical protein [Leishmania infantum JPCM5]SUZ41113.1 hypothetical_protein_-_conserved [Leishmania infantum]|eukprot:XP_003392420.1 conserved hypothetical protein [Leishmania infantum JPCM5]